MVFKRLSGAALAEVLGERTGHIFRDHEKLQSALTHASARGARGGLDYERFEFLGDRVLGLIVAEMLFKAFPNAPEGELSVRLNALVNAEVLADIADEIGLPDMIRAGNEVKSLGGRKRINIRADALESLIAAIYLEGGLDAARTFIERYWTKRSQASGAARRDAKTALQEWAHQIAAAVPIYVIESREGPDHDPLFSVSVTVGAFQPEKGTGRSKREAEQVAATALLTREGVWGSEKDKP
jgi:ribonuclease-3